MNNKTFGTSILKCSWGRVRNNQPASSGNGLAGMAGVSSTLQSLGQSPFGNPLQVNANNISLSALTQPGFGAYNPYASAVSNYNTAAKVSPSQTAMTVNNPAMMQQMMLMKMYQQQMAAASNPTAAMQNNPYMQQMQQVALQGTNQNAALPGTRPGL